LLQRGINIDDLTETELNQMINEDEEFWPKREVNIFRPEHSFVRPTMLIYSGSARCVNDAFPNSKFLAKRLATGSIMGESDTI